MHVKLGISKNKEGVKPVNFIKNVFKGYYSRFLTATKKTPTFVEFVLVAGSVAANNIPCDYCRISKENLVGYVVLKLC